MIRGRDVKKWYVNYNSNKYILIPHNKDGKPITHKNMRLYYPYTWKYFLNFFNDLIRRGGEPYKTQLEPYREKGLEKGETRSPPFYYLFNVENSLSEYKVVYKYITGAITGKASDFAAAVVEPINDKWLGYKQLIPNEKLMLVGVNNKDEAYYLSAIINSTIVKTIIASYVIETEISTHIIKNIAIPQFNDKDTIHKNLAELAKKAHEITKDIANGNNLNDALNNIEEEIDRHVARLYDISEDKLVEFKKMLTILSNKEFIEEEEEEIELPDEPSVNVLNTVLELNKDNHIEVSIVNPTDKEFTIELEFPWGSKKLSVKDGSYKIDIPKLEIGTYNGKIKWYWDDKVNENEFTIEVREKQIRRKRTLRLEDE